jgi:hypothetical protein
VIIEGLENRKTQPDISFTTVKIKVGDLVQLIKKEKTIEVYYNNQYHLGTVPSKYTSEINIKLYHNAVIKMMNPKAVTVDFTLECITDFDVEIRNALADLEELEAINSSEFEKLALLFRDKKIYYLNYPQNRNMENKLYGTNEHHNRNYLRNKIKIELESGNISDRTIYETFNKMNEKSALEPRLEKRIKELDNTYGINIPLNSFPNIRTTVCWKCGLSLTSYTHKECNSCRWLVCKCGACKQGCSL